MTVGPDDEAPRSAHTGAASEAVTVAFGDSGAELFGIARLGMADGAASGLAIVFHRGAPVAVRSEGAAVVGDVASWQEISAAGLDTEVVEPLRRWRLRFASEEASLDVELAATAPPAELPEEDPVARAGGMAGYEQPCRVTGTAVVGGQRIRLEGLGQRGHSWGAPDWERIALARTVAAWLDDELSVSLTAIRPTSSAHHEDELVAATVVSRDRESGEPRALRAAEPRLSTTYDGDGRQRTAGLELIMDGDGFTRQAAGEVLCGTTLDLGRLRLDCAFLRWRMEGRVGFGRYDILRRVPPP